MKKPEATAVTSPSFELVVALDGPSGAGKSSIGKKVAKLLGLAFIDTGAMYRAVTWAVLEYLDNNPDETEVMDLLDQLEINLNTVPGADKVTIQYAGQTQHDITKAIRQPRIAESVSTIAQNLAVREELISRQRALIATTGYKAIVDGRDITTVVAPDAQVRLILTASQEARMERRKGQLIKNSKVDVEAQDIINQTLNRDKKDSQVASFTTPADGVFTIDSSELTFKETVDAFVDLVVREVPEVQNVLKGRAKNNYVYNRSSKRSPASSL